MKKVNNTHILGKAILFSSIQLAIGALEMNDKFSVRISTTNQDMINEAFVALKDSIILSVFWLIISSFIFFEDYGIMGMMYNILGNLFFMIYMYTSYIRSLKVAARKYNLQLPKNIYINI
jgi:hypothetical protein